MKFVVIIHRKDHSFKSEVILDSEIDRVEGLPVTSSTLAEEYAKKYLKNEGDYCIAYKRQ